MDIRTLGIAVDSSPVEKANANLDKLAATGAKAEAVAQKMATGFSNAARDVERQSFRMVSDIQRLQRQHDELSHTIADTGRATAPAARAAEEFTSKLKKTGDTADQVARQMRMVAPQITDVVTQLSGGASPLQVLIQQGGQLKDVFGGIGPAARAVGGYVAGLVNPFTVAAAVVGALGFAYHEGAAETKAFNEAIVTSGNQAGTTTGQLQGMARQIALTTGTVGAAADVLTMMVAAGKIPQENLQQYALMAVRLQRVGVDAKDTVTDLAALGANPVSASVKLNDSLNYLTASTYRQIKALDDLGLQQRAADVAQQAYADAQNQRVPQLESQIGTLAKAWNFLTDAIKDAGNELKNIGRAPGLEQQLALVQDQLRVARGQDPNRPFQLPFGPSVSDLQEQERRLLRMQDIQHGSAAAQAQQADQTRAMVDFEKLAEGSMSRQERIQRDIAKARNLGLAAGASQAEIEKTIAGIAYEESKLGIEAQIERLQSIQQVMEVRTKGVLADLDAQRKMGAVSERAYIEQTAAAEIAAMQNRRALLEQQIGLKAKERDSEKEVAALRGQEAVLDAQIGERKKQLVLDTKVYVELLERARALAFVQAGQEFRGDWNKAIVESGQAFDAAQMEIARWKQDIQDSNDDLGFQISLLGKSTHEQELANAQRRMAVDLKRQERKIDQDTTFDPEQKRILKEQVQRVAESADAASAVWVKEWKDANREVGDSLFDALTGKGKSAADRLKRLFAELVLKPRILAEFQPLTSGITSFLVGGSPGASAGVPPNPFVSGGMDFLGNSGLMSSVGLGGFSIGNTIGTTFANITGTGIDGLVAATGGWGTGAGAGLLGSIGTALPYVGAAIAIASMLGIGKGGETRSGATYRNGAVLHGPSGGQINGAQAATTATMDSINGLLGQLGSSAHLTDFLSALESSKNGKGFAYAGGTLSTGATFGQFNESAGRSNRRGSMTVEEATAAYGEELKQATLQALQAANVPGLVGDYLRSLGDIDAISGGALDAAIARVQKALKEKQTLEETWYQLTANDAEKLAHARQLELDALDISNRAMAVRVYALQDEITAQQKAKAAYADVTGAIDDLSKRVGAYLDKLAATGAGMGSPESQLAAAQSQFGRQLALARSGNRDAMGSITDYADQYIQAQTAYTASGPATQAVIAQVRAALGALPDQMNAEEFVAKAVENGAFLLNATMNDLIARADANSAAQIAAITKQANDENAARQAQATAASASAAAASAAADAQANSVTKGWTITENGWTWVGAGNAPGIDPFHRFASGGYHSGGWRLVGEDGPELEATGPSRIFTAQQTQRILGGAGSDPEVKALLRQVISGLDRLARVGMAGARGSMELLDAIAGNTGAVAGAASLQRTRPAA